MAAREVRVGQVVKSLAGRDRDRYFLVLSVVDERHVLVTDGDLRRVDRPKRKNVRHLEPAPQVAEAVAAALARGEKVQDSEVRSALLAVLGRSAGPGREEG
ncbi:MAG: KOW domain-containing RNA-binding protein [Acetobacteraceae bacterium]|nr:KOW domain-containing RNA-binding protein [Acetobacteraceae bacterium]